MQDAASRADTGKWEFWIDRGGTFTDLVARRPDGSWVTHKLLSENPRQYPDAATHGIRWLLGLDADQSLAGQPIAAVKMGTTVATNALLTRRGEPVLLVINRGFADQLQIGSQQRPDLFALHVQLPPVLYQQVLEVDARLNARGDVLVAPDADVISRQLATCYEQGLRAVAIVLMHGYRYPAHEQLIADLARQVGFSQISTSCEVNPLPKLVPRGSTTVVDAYLSPVLGRYVQEVSAALQEMRSKGGRLQFMQSSGGLTDAGSFRGKDAILSGPAAGVVGMARVCMAAGHKQVIGFDMGGTSTDVSHYQGEFEQTLETRVAGVHIRAPMMQIHTVAAGGGSVLHFDGARYRVGPDSAAAWPGPACYGNGGPLTVTDCNLMLGRLQAELFPALFGASGTEPLQVDPVRRGFTELAGKIRKQTGDSRSPEQVAEGFLTIAVENMANAIRKISVQRGYDISGYTLCCFGGAGGQSACAVADALGMQCVFIHPHAGVLSAYGMGLADTLVNRQKAVDDTLVEAHLPQLAQQLHVLQEEGQDSLLQQGLPAAELHSRWLLHVCYQGTDNTLCVDYAPLAQMVQQFETLHRMRFGFLSPEKPLLVESLQVEVRAPAAPLLATATQPVADSVKPQTHRCFIGGNWQDIPFYRREHIPSARQIAGPAVILDATGTVLVAPGWNAELSDVRNLILRRQDYRADTRRLDTRADPVMLEVFNNLFMSVAEQMGVVLEHTAASVNIKERLDFSCALFTPQGALVANAPHIPVHLGSMSQSVKAVLQQQGDALRPGDAWLLNVPWSGGTHLPDVTVVRPVFDAHGTQLLFFVAARGHHADIGGTTPGSMPTDSTRIEEEGILIDTFALVQDGHFREQELRKLLTTGPWPARNPELNLGDFRAQLAACEQGARELTKLVQKYGLDVVHAYMGHVQDNAELSVRRLLARVRGGSFACALDDGHRVCVQITVDQNAGSAVVDFTGTSAQHPGNFNAPTSVVRAAVLYVLRCLVNDDIPLNDGCLVPVQLIIPEQSMINPDRRAAVVAGNVETSQLLVDALLGSLGVAAAAQGTMNNFIWGDDEFQYYETLGGGTGATEQGPGAHGVHSHMTNSRLTDPEILEARFPVLLESFALRRGSGGTGKHPGGCGTVRRVRFLRPMTAIILSGRRRLPPWGLAGGGGGCNGGKPVATGC